MRLACVVGARPNFIKIAPILKAIRLHSSRITPFLIHTGQHYDTQLSDIFFQDLDIPSPNYSLGISSGTPAEQTGAILRGFDNLCSKNLFDRVLVVGDVTSTFACALASVKQGIPVDHVEAGLRSFDRSMPEEINRILTDSVSSLFFVSEVDGISNLRREGHPEDQIKHVGNVMIDSLMSHRKQAAERKAYESFGLKPKNYILATLHRQSNVDNPEMLKILTTGLANVSRKLPVLFPVHPRTRKFLTSSNLPETVHLCEPLGYLDFLSVMNQAKLVITDSGGIQEETTALAIPCLTMRTNTERPSTVQIGTNTLIGHDLGALSRHLETILEGSYKKGTVPPLWDGCASERIASVLCKYAQ